MKIINIQKEHFSQKSSSHHSRVNEKDPKQRSQKRLADFFPFTTELKEYPVTREHQYPNLPLALHCTMTRPCLCYYVLMTDGLYHGSGDKPYEFRLDIPTINELGGTAPTTGAGIAAWSSRKMTVVGRNPNKDESAVDKYFDIDLSIDQLHPLLLLPEDLANYLLKLQIFFRRSTTPRDTPKSRVRHSETVSDFDEI